MGELKNEVVHREGVVASGVLLVLVGFAAALVMFGYFFGIGLQLAMRTLGG